MAEQALDDLLLAVQRQRPRVENDHVSGLAVLALAEHPQAVDGLVVRVVVAVLYPGRRDERTAAVAERLDVPLRNGGPINGMSPPLTLWPLYARLNSRVVTAVPAYQVNGVPE